MWRLETLPFVSNSAIKGVTVNHPVYLASSYKVRVCSQYILS